MGSQIFIPTLLMDSIDEIESAIDQMELLDPNCIGDYFLVDQLREEIVIKSFKKNEVDMICSKHNITPRDYCMAVMRKQGN